MYNSIYPTYARPYLGVNNRQIRKKQDEEKNSQSSKSVENNLQEERKQPRDNATYFPNGEKVAIDYTRKRIGIEQVLSDFRNTTNAIGAPDDIKAEVQTYLSLVENQAQKAIPNSQIIQSNLKNASQILDEYITNTLQKPSKVVENWVDTLFLQHIDYKMPVQENTEQEAIVEEKIEENAVSAQENTEDVKITERKQNDIYVPENQQLKRMFIQAKKYAAIDDNNKALAAFQNTMDYADEIGDYQACGIIHYEQARIYDDMNMVEDALYNYDRAARQSNDNNIKARSHISMGKIYDEYVNFEPAVEHYCAAVSFAGEADNLKLQTKALIDLAQLHTNRYDKQNAYLFMDMASVSADETNDAKTKGYTALKSAKLCEKLDDTSKALYLYADSAKESSKLNDDENLAKSYQSAALLMKKYGNNAKAKKLMGKAYVAAQRTDNRELKTQITHQIELLS